MDSETDNKERGAARLVHIPRASNHGSGLQGQMEQLREIVHQLGERVQSINEQMETYFSEAVSAFESISVTKTVEPLLEQFKHTISAPLRMMPENIPSENGELTFREIADFVKSSPIPLYRIPRAHIVLELINAQSLSEQLSVISGHKAAILEDCNEYLSQCSAHGLEAEIRQYIIEAINAFNAGFYSAAQALAANTLESLVRILYEDKTSWNETRDVVRSGDLPINKQNIKMWLLISPLGKAFENYDGKKVENIPFMFNRHASAHSVGSTQYSEVNAVIGIMLTASLLVANSESPEGD